MSGAPIRAAAEAAEAEGRLRRPVAVLLSRFPLVTETFILREVEELERQGHPVVLVPLMREDPPVIHEAARGWCDRALFTPWLSLGGLGALMRQARRTPAILLSAVAIALLGNAPSPASFFKTLVLLPKAIHLAALLEARGVDHLHAHFATHPAMVAWLIWRLTGIPYSVTTHAHDIFVRHPMLPRKVRDAAFVRTISDFNRRYLERLVPDDGTPRPLIRVGVDLGHYHHPGRRPRVDGRAEILCIAALKPYKGLEVLLRALAALPAEGPAWRCRIVGEGPLRRRLEGVRARLGLTESVELIGACTETEVIELLRASTLLVQPSVIASDGQMEGIPVSLMEALASGVPVVASRLSGIPELVEDGVGGWLVEPANAEELCAAISRLLRDSELRRRLAAGGRERVTSAFCLTHSVAALAAEIDACRADGETLPHPSALPRDAVGSVVDWTVEGPDSRVLGLRKPGNAGCTAVVKEHLSRVGASRSPARRARREAEILTRLHELGEGRDAKLGLTLTVPALLGSAGAIVVLEPLPGRRLDDELRRHRLSRDPGLLLRWVEGAGAWLAWFQRSLRPATPGKHPQLAERATAALGNELDRGRRRRLEREIETLDLASRAEGPRIAVVHGDFWPGNLLVDGARISAVDFEGHRLGSELEDAVNFVLHLGLFLTLPSLRRRRQTVVSAFTHAWGEAATPSPAPASWRLCEIAAALELLSAPSHGSVAGRLPWSQANDLRRVLDRRWRGER